MTDIQPPTDRKLRVLDLMTSPAITVGPETAFADILNLLLANDISGAPVVDDEARLLGIVTEADLLSNEAYGSDRRNPLELVGNYLRGNDPQWVRKASGLTARELMTGAPEVARPDEDVATAARRMLESHHKRLPVVADDRVVGVISRQDLLRAF